MVGPTFPRDPLARFLELAAALEERRRWFQGAAFLRYAAATLTTIDGDPRRIAEQVATTAAGLQRRAGWFGTLQGDVRFVVAAMLVRDGHDAARFHTALEHGRQLFRRAGLRRGEAHEILALLVLWLGRGGESIRTADVRRLADVRAGMAEHHPWLTGVDDYPACALLALRDEPVHRQMQRIERFYRELRHSGLSLGNRLQMLSHLLYFNPADDEVVLRRFSALHERFRHAGIAMWSSDWDELALLTFVDAPARQVVDTVVRHRTAMRGLRPRPDVTLSFSLACGTAFLELLRADGPIRDAQALASIQQVLAAQQAAMIAAISGGAVAASAASH